MTCSFKAGDRKHPGNHRPITNLPSFSKILEKKVKTRLHEYLLSSELLVPEQYGFRKGMNTEHAIPSVIQAVHNFKRLLTHLTERYCSTK